MAEHLDKTKAKRHALFFTKLRVLELPYRMALLLDIECIVAESRNGTPGIQHEQLDQMKLQTA